MARALNTRIRQLTIANVVACAKCRRFSSNENCQQVIDFVACYRLRQRQQHRHKWWWQQPRHHFDRFLFLFVPHFFFFVFALNWTIERRVRLAKRKIHSKRKCCLCWRECRVHHRNEQFKLLPLASIHSSFTFYIDRWLIYLQVVFELLVPEAKRLFRFIVRPTARKMFRLE